MGYSGRYFLVDTDGTIYRVTNKFAYALYRNESDRALPVLAGRRMRLAELWVELTDRRVTRVLRINCSYLSFDSRGVPDRDVIRRDFRAVLTNAEGDTGNRAFSANTIDMSNRFIARGARWHPSDDMRKALEGAAKGEQPTVYLSAKSVAR